MIRTLILGIAISAAALPAWQSASRRLPRWPAGAIIAVWSDVRAAPPGAEVLIGKALDTWTRAAAGRFVLRRAAPSDSPRIRVRFADADGVYGETSPRIDRATGMITSAEVLIAATVSGDSIRQRVVIYLTALHELGHALGLPHTDAFEDIMYAFRRPDDGERYFGAYQRRLRSVEDIGTGGANGLSAADTAALHALYDR